MDTKRNAALRLPLQQEIGWKSEVSSKQVRLDSIPPSGGSGIDASKKLELPPTKKDDLKAPSKKSGSTIKKEKPKQMPPKVKGAEPWHDCPAEFLSYAKEGMVSARVSIPGPGFVLKEAGFQSRLFITETPGFSEKIDSAPSSTSLDKLPSTPLGTGRGESLGTGKNSSSTRTKSKPTSPSRSFGTSPKPKGKSK